MLLHDNDRFGRPGMWKAGLDALELVADELDRRRLRAVTIEELVA